MPALSGFESVMHNHGADMIGHPNATWGILEGNPLWEEMRDTAVRLSEVQAAKGLREKTALAPSLPPPFPPSSISVLKSQLCGTLPRLCLSGCLSAALTTRNHSIDGRCSLYCPLSTHSEGICTEKHMEQRTAVRTQGSAIAFMSMIGRDNHGGERARMRATASKMARHRSTICAAWSPRA